MKKLLLILALLITPPSAYSQGSGQFGGPGQIPAGTVVLDMNNIAGADLGAKMNNCDTQLPASGGICMGDNLTGTQTLSTVVTTTKNTVFTFCGQAITQTANVNLNSYGASVIGCSGGGTTFTKAANIDQFTVNFTFNRIAYLVIDGALEGGFTGNGITVNFTSDMTYFTNDTYIDHNTIQNEKGDALNNGGFWVYISENHILNWGTHAIEESGVGYFSDNHIQGDGTATGSAIVITGQPTFTDNYIIDQSAGHTIIDASGTNGIVPLTGNNIEEISGSTAINGGVQMSAVNNFISGGGANGPGIIGAGSYTNNVLVFGNNDGMQIKSASNLSVSGNIISMAVSASSGFCAVNVKGETIGARIANNQVDITGTESGANYGICLTTVAANHTLDNIISSNDIESSITSSVDAAMRFDNTAAVATSISNNRFVNNNCIHFHFCVARVDTGNNGTNYYENLQGDPVATFDAGGSNKDVILQLTDSVGITFATLPIAGSGSQVYCTDCTQGVPAGSGAGGLLIRNQATWETIPSPIAPTVSSGFGTGAAVVAGGLPASFRLGVGTSNTGTGVISLPTAKTGWNCYATNVTTKNTNQATVLQTADTTASVTLQNYTDIMGTHAMTDSDVLSISCFPH